VPSNELLFGILLVAILLVMAAIFAWRQWLTLRGLRDDADLSTEDWRYTHNQAWRRLVCAGLMVILAVLLGSTLFIGKPIDEMVARGEAGKQAEKLRPEALAGLAAAPDAGFPGNLPWAGLYHAASNPRQSLPLEDQRYLNRFLRHIILLLLVLLVLIGVAAADWIAIRRYGQRHYRQIQADRRAMIKTEIARIRSQRNGHG
jgi:hypothetical protein